MPYKFNPFTGNLDEVTDATESQDELLKVSDNDTTAGYLNGKLVAGLNASLTEDNDGSNETLTVRGKAEVQTGAPSTPHTGAIWLDTDEDYSSIYTVTTTTYNVDNLYTVLLVDDDTAGSTVTLTLPPVSANTGITFTIKKTGSTADVIIDGAVSETIDGETTITIDAQYESVTIVCDGSAWHIL